jgi:hypothetical protein
MYDLRGPRLSARSSYVKFTDEMEQALSAQRHLDKLNTPLMIGCGTLDTLRSSSGSHASLPRPYVARASRSS